MATAILYAIRCTLYASYEMAQKRYNKVTVWIFEN